MYYDETPWKAGALEARDEDNTPDEDTRTEEQKNRDADALYEMARKEGWI